MLPVELLKPGDMALCWGKPGSGLTSVGLQMAQSVLNPSNTTTRATATATAAVAWFQPPGERLTPYSFQKFQLWQKDLLIIEAQEQESKNLKALSEVLQSRLFSLVIFERNKNLPILTKDLEKLKRFAFAQKSNLLILQQSTKSSHPLRWSEHLFSLIARTQPESLLIERAKHKHGFLNPYTLPRSPEHAHRLLDLSEVHFGKPAANVS